MRQLAIFVLGLVIGAVAMYVALWVDFAYHLIEL